MMEAPTSWAADELGLAKGSPFRGKRGGKAERPDGYGQTATPST